MRRGQCPLQIPLDPPRPQPPIPRPDSVGPHQILAYIHRRVLMPRRFRAYCSLVAALSPECGLHRNNQHLKHRYMTRCAAADDSVTLYTIFYKIIYIYTQGRARTHTRMHYTGEHLARYYYM